MFVAGNLVRAIATVLNMLLTAYYWIIIIYTVMSWLSPDPYNPIVRFIRGVVDPFLDQIRRLLPFSVGPIDFSPFIGILLIMFTQYFVIRTLFDVAARLQ